MEWHIAPHTRLDIHVFSGINFSGERRVTSIHPAGGRQGNALNNFAFRSIAISGPIGTTLVMCTSVLDIGWEARPWRAIRVIKGEGFKTKEGKIAVRAPELDWFDASNAHRTDPDFQQTFPQVTKFEDGTGWSFGRSGTMVLNDNIKQMRAFRDR
jgi:hypothetical protein